MIFGAMAGFGAIADRDEAGRDGAVAFCVMVSVCVCSPVACAWMRRICRKGVTETEADEDDVPASAVEDEYVQTFGALLREAVANATHLLIFYLMVSYITLVLTCLRISQCKTNLDGVSYLVSNPDLACQDRAPMDPTPLYGHADDFKVFGNYSNILLMSRCCAVLYGVGIPIMFFAIAASGREDLATDSHRSKYGLLTDPVRKEHFYWEACVTMRKGCLTTVTMTMTPAHSSTVDTQTITDKNVAAALLCLAVIMIFLVAHCSAQPYNDGEWNKMELVSLMAQFLILLMGLGFQTQSAFGAGDGFMFILLNTLQYLVYVVVMITQYFICSAIIKKWAASSLMEKSSLLSAIKGKTRGSRSAEDDTLVAAAADDTASFVTTAADAVEAADRHFDRISGQVQGINLDANSTGLIEDLTSFEASCTRSDALQEFLDAPVDQQPLDPALLPFVDAWMAHAPAASATVVATMLQEVMEMKARSDAQGSATRESLLHRINAIECVAKGAPSRRVEAWIASTSTENAEALHRSLNMHPSVYGVQYALLPPRVYKMMGNQIWSIPAFAKMFVVCLAGLAVLVPLLSTTPTPEMCALDPDRAWFKAGFTLGPKYDLSGTSGVATLEECKQRCCETAECAGLSRWKSTYNFTSGETHVIAASETSECNMKTVLSWADIDEVPNYERQIGSKERVADLLEASSEMFYRSRAAYSLRPGQHDFLEKPKCETGMSRSGNVAVVTIILVGVSGFFVTTYAALGADITDWQDEELEPIHDWPASKLPTNMVLVTSVCWPYMQFASMGFHQTLRWSKTAQTVLTTIADYADLHIPNTM
eukprot:SAG22_NODE_574_length_8996_cov_12.163875_6_plen_823_part_00